MAESNNPLSFVGTTFVMSDATGTPLTYTFIMEGGSLDIDEGKTADVFMNDNDGTRMGVTSGAPTKFATVGLTGKIRDVSKHATDVSWMDVVNQTGVVGSTWVSTADTVSGKRKRFNLTITVPDRVLPSGTVKGGTWLFEDVDVTEGVKYTLSRDGGWVGTCTIESMKMAGTWTRAT